MKQYFKIALSLLLSFVMAGQVNAQTEKHTGGLQLHLNYNYGIPLGSFKNDMVSKGSASGFSGDLMYQINPQWAAGLTAGYQNFTEKYPRAIYETGDHEVTSAVLTNAVEINPIMAKGVFTPLAGNGKVLQPYISAAAGMNLLLYRQYLGEFGGSDNKATFMAQAGAGLNISLGKKKEAGFTIGADYNFIPYNKYGFKNMNNLGLHAGFYFPLK